MPKAKKSLLVKVSSTKAKCRVSRSFIVVQSGDRVKFSNRTAGSVHIHVSEKRLFSKEFFSISKNKEKTLVARKVSRGVYPYAVFCEDKARFCTGSSMPIIIVPR